MTKYRQALVLDNLKPPVKFLIDILKDIVIFDSSCLKKFKGQENIFIFTVEFHKIFNEWLQNTAIKTYSIELNTLSRHIQETGLASTNIQKIGKRAKGFRFTKSELLDIMKTYLKDPNFHPCESNQPVDIPDDEQDPFDHTTVASVSELGNDDIDELDMESWLNV